jgi:DNA replication and repair protein RecF
MIADLRLQHFRSYSDDSFEFSPGVNIVVGPNASGKTNLLEAVLVAARGNSYRVKDGELIQFDEPWARLDAHLANNTLRTVKVVSEPRPSKSYEIDGKPYKRLSMAHTLPVVLFEPNHLQLLSGGPERRRTYLDDLLEQTTPGYNSTRLKYRRALAQRNALLKRFAGDTTLIFPWNVRLSQLAGQIVRARDSLVTKLNISLVDLYKDISHTTTSVEASYQSRWDPEAYETNLLKKLEADLELDRLRGFTGAGPHREDMVVTFNGHPSAETASRGEARTAVLALKIIELQIIEEARGITPLLLLDDVFSELDGGRRHALTDYLKNYQTFITTTDADLVLQHFTDACHVIPVTPKTT